MIIVEFGKYSSHINASTQQGVNIMAKLHNNIVILGLTGAVVAELSNHKAHARKTAATQRPIFYDHPPYARSEKAEINALCAAATYADFAKTQEIYLDKAIETGTAA